MLRGLGIDSLSIDLGAWMDLAGVCKKQVLVVRAWRKYTSYAGRTCS